MSDRKKLKEELFDLFWDTEQMRFMRSSIQECVDYLISNGVTVQKWIPVSERLPKEEGWYWVFTTPDRGYRSINKGEFRKGYHWNNFTPYWRGAGGTWTNVTHWMPLPKPPKECE